MNGNNKQSQNTKNSAIKYRINEELKISLYEKQKNKKLMYIYHLLTYNTLLMYFILFIPCTVDNQLTPYSVQQNYLY